MLIRIGFAVLHVTEVAKINTAGSDPCCSCAGTGRVKEDESTWPASGGCGNCSGSGKVGYIHTARCSTCGGLGYTT